ncbi:hypothetical protein Sme01_03900 [Sphaerisporangium melleum]|uniref:Uncharacterized protein n=1 Tax=Sphaerisporangium melleum TaxID=321316 RepID=A0A917QQF4_9ACTN|nr:hypothetical protein [Sphaerisporangium melleum]GGK62000.1 hypothetical protein GCM10007964_01450 [Sphaerisporangium melleum]GII67914.1 hypothetical protein Sme01_03900 [Sphaerisporangium melleum]
MNARLDSADLLRRAAAKLRETAAGTTSGDWDVRDSGELVAWQDTEDQRFEYLVECVEWENPADPKWIAVASPALAEPLAAWLEEVARQYEMAPCNSPDGLCNGCERRDDFVYAFNVAQAILGETAPPSRMFADTKPVEAEVGS